MSFYRLKDNQKQFLKKIKEQELQAEKRKKQQNSATRLAAVIRKYISNCRTVSPIIKQAEEKIMAIVIKKKQIDSQKFSRMMSNAVFKMPIIMSPVSLISFQSLPSYSDYVLKLTTALTTQPGNQNIILKKILEANDIRTIQLIKLTQFTIRISQKNQICQQFLGQFIQTCTRNQFSFDPLSEIINQNTLTYLKQLIFDEKLNHNYSNLFLNEIFLKRFDKFQKILAPLDIFHLIMTISNLSIESLEKLCKFIDKNNELSITVKEYIKSRNVKDLNVLYQQSIFLINRLSSKVSSSLIKAFQIHNTILLSLYNITFSGIYNKIYGKKLAPDDKDQINQRNARVRRTQQYRSFLDNVNLELCFGPMLELFKEVIQFHPSQPILNSLCQLYLLLEELFRKTHTKIFNRLTTIEILSYLYNLVCKLDSNTMDFKNRSKETMVLQLFVTITLHKFNELDDVQFTNPQISFNQHTLQHIIVMLLKLTILLSKKPVNDRLFQDASSLLNDMYKKVFRTKYISLKIFESENLDQLLQNFKGNKKQNNNIQLLLKTIPFGFSFEARLSKFRQFIKNDKKNFNRNLGLDQQYDNDHTVEIRRGYQFNDAFQQLANREMRQKYKIVYINEQGVQQEGVDGGGIIKQLINQIIKVAFNPIYGLFFETQKKQIIPNPHSNIQNMKSQLEFIGKLVGKAIYQNILIEPKFAGPFLNIMIGKQNSFEDLQFLDKALYKSLLDIKHSKQDISNFQLTFSVTQTDSQGNMKTIQLKENGKNILVTEENKLQFVMAYADYKVNRQFFQQGRFFRKGFVQIIQEQWLEMFNYQQLNLMISGISTNFNVYDLMQNTVYTGYQPKDLTVRYFWEVLSEMSLDEKGLFLHYVTSCSRPPTLGFKELKPKFCISKTSDGVEHLPTVHTCMNLLKLPNYGNKQILKQKLTYAIHAKAGFEVT